MRESVDTKKCVLWGTNAEIFNAKRGNLFKEG